MAKLITINGEKKTVAAWANDSRCKVSASTLQTRVSESGGATHFNESIIQPSPNKGGRKPVGADRANYGESGKKYRAESTKHFCYREPIPFGTQIVFACRVCGKHQYFTKMKITAPLYNTYQYNDKYLSAKEIGKIEGIHENSVRNRYLRDMFWWSEAGKERTVERKRLASMRKSSAHKRRNGTDVAKAKPRLKHDAFDSPLPGWHKLRECEGAV